MSTTQLPCSWLSRHHKQQLRHQHDGHKPHLAGISASSGFQIAQKTNIHLDTQRVCRPPCCQTDEQTRRRSSMTRLPGQHSSMMCPTDLQQTDSRLTCGLSSLADPEKAQREHHGETSGQTSPCPNSDTEDNNKQLEANLEPGHNLPSPKSGRTTCHEQHHWSPNSPAVTAISLPRA